MKRILLSAVRYTTYSGGNRPCVNIATLSCWSAKTLKYDGARKPRKGPFLRQLQNDLSKTYMLIEVSIDEKTAEHLAKWKGIQQAELLKIGIRQDGLTSVCCSGFGQIVHPDDFSHWFERFRKDAGFPKLKFHELRHTQATLLLGNGVDVKTVQTRLGHSDASVTLNTYSHALPENDKKAANLIGDLFATNKKAARKNNVRTAWLRCA